MLHLSEFPQKSWLNCTQFNNAKPTSRVVGTESARSLRAPPILGEIEPKLVSNFAFLHSLNLAICYDPDLCF